MFESNAASTSLQVITRRTLNKLQFSVFIWAQCRHHYELFDFRRVKVIYLGCLFRFSFILIYNFTKQKQLPHSCCFESIKSQQPTLEFSFANLQFFCFSIMSSFLIPGWINRVFVLEELERFIRKGLEHKTFKFLRGVVLQILLIRRIV